MSIKGKVKWFNPTKGYGFIEREDKEKDVFVHSSAAQAASLQLNEGDELTFEVESGEKGPSAVNLQITSERLKDFRHFIAFLKSRGNFRSFESNLGFVRPIFVKIWPFEIYQFFTFQIKIKKK